VANTSVTPVAAPATTINNLTTTPVAAPATTINNLTTGFLSVEKTWLQKHERLLIVFMVLVVGYFGINHYLNNAAAKAETRATIAEAAATQAKAQVADSQAKAAAAAVQTAQVTQQYQAMVQTLTDQTKALATALAQRQATLVVQQKADMTMPTDDLAKKLQTEGNAPAGSVTISGDNIALSRPGAVAIAQSLDQIPFLQGNLKDETALEQAEAAAKAAGDKVIDAQVAQIGSLNGQIATMQKAEAATDKANKTEVAQLKDDARKSKWRWFRRGFIAGNITGFLGGLYAGHAGL
jgi:uncharacterized membrane protein